jgi:transposase
MRPIGTPKQLQQRRQQALRLLKRGWRMAEVAQVVGATPRSLRRWRKQAKRTRRPGRSPRCSPGRPCRLTCRQIDRLKRALRCGSLACGYPADYWTLARVRWLIRDHFQVAYQASSVWYLLRRMKWSCQKPQRLAFQRDEAAIVYWKRYRWPWIKKVADLGRDPGFSR